MVEKEIVLDKDSLLYEIENVVDKISRSRDEQNIQVQADETEQDRAITMRSIDNSINVVRSKMRAYVVDDGEGIKLQFPDEWKASVFPDLVVSIQEYVINAGICDWLRVTLPREAREYGERAEVCLGRVKSCVTARAVCVRRPLQPF